MSMSLDLPTLTLIIKGAVSDAVQGIRAVKKETERTKGAMDSFADAGRRAAGFLIRDMVRGASAAVNEVLNLGAAFGTLRTSFDRLLLASGTMDQSLENLRKATRYAIADVDLLKAANLSMMLGLPIDELDEMYDAAIRVGAAAGMTATQSINDFTIALGRQQPKILDNFGIKLGLAEAEELYAAQLGKSTSALTDQEREIAFATIAIQKMNDQASILGENIDAAALKGEQWSASWKNLATSVGEFLKPLKAIQPILNPVMNMFGIMAGTVLPKLIGAIWAEVVALKAKIAAWITAHSVATLGLGLAAIGAAIGGAALLTGGVLGGIPSKQFGGLITETGPYLLHRGETVIPPGSTDRSIHIANMTVYPHDAKDFIHKMRALGIGS